MKNLQALYTFCHETPACSFVVAIAPRGFQYDARETPHNRESHMYDVMGTYALEPFRYFDLVGSSLPYPVINLFTAFSESEESPLFLENDPRWNLAGCRLVARSLLKYLAENELIP